MPSSDRALPEPLRGSEVGTFAHQTVTVRLPEIARRVLAENAFLHPIPEQLKALIGELPHGPVRPLLDAAAPDAECWRSYIAPHEGRSWLEVPWFFAETYFYRRILEATGYFEDGPDVRVDPFAYQKRRGLETARADTRRLAAWLEENQTTAWRREVFLSLLQFDLWGNQADLSLWPADEAGQPRHADLAEARAHLLADDSAAAAGYVADLRQMRLDVVVDNAGFELVGDLCLADDLLRTGKAAVVHLHLKAHPTFVSDALVEDVFQTIAFLAEDDAPEVRRLAAQLRRYLEEQRLRTHADLYWTSPLPGWEMPAALHEALSGADLVLSKGDANYRRLLGDRHWPFETPLVEALGYFPAPLVALRTLKSEVAVGLEPGRLKVLSQQDPAWLTNGRWGMIQFLG